MLIKASKRLVMTGDSITDCGRARPVGADDGLGDGYVRFVRGLLAARHPDQPVEILNTGIGGNRITDLQKRWQSDVLDLQPDWLSVMIGINDVWRQFDNPLNPQQVDITTFETVYDELLTETRPGITGLVLMTPYFIEPNRKDPMRAMMDEYSAAVKRMADKHDAIYVDVQAAFDSYLEHASSETLCGDRVHPKTAGHMIIAHAFLSAIEMAW